MFFLLNLRILDYFPDIKINNTNNTNFPFVLFFIGFSVLMAKGSLSNIKFKK